MTLDNKDLLLQQQQEALFSRLAPPSIRGLAPGIRNEKLQSEARRTHSCYLKRKLFQGQEMGECFHFKATKGPIN